MLAVAHSEHDSCLLRTVARLDPGRVRPGSESILSLARVLPGLRLAGHFSHRVQVQVQVQVTGGHRWLLGHPSHLHKLMLDLPLAYENSANSISRDRPLGPRSLSLEIALAGLSRWTDS